MTLQNTYSDWRANEKHETSESKQVETLRRVLTEYVLKDWSEISKGYPKIGNARLHFAKIIPYSYINKRLSSDAAFKKDRFGATNAIKRAIETLKDNGVILETLGLAYSYYGRCYLVNLVQRSNDNLICK